MLKSSGEGRKPRRVIISDPSLRDFVGHHFAYDKSILEALADHGIDGAVLAHKDVRRFLPEDERILPVYTEDMWRNIRARGEGHFEWGSLPLESLRLLLAPLFFAETVFAVLLPRLIARLCRVQAAREVPDRAQWSAPRKPGHGSGGVLRERAMRTPVTRALWITLRELYRLAKAPWQVIGYLIDNFRVPRWLLRVVLPNPTFYVETRAALRARGIGGGDLIFAHMLIHCHLLEWALIALGEARQRSAQVLLLFRYPVDFYQPRRLSTQLAFRALEQAWDAGCLRLATDSERLAREFAAHTFIPIEVFPIPHVVTPTPAPVGVPDGVLRVASLGNARAEKGIIEIMRAIESLHASQDADGLEFVLQVNDPDMKCRGELARFRERGLPGIRYIDSALDDGGYAELLRSVDVVLVPYWRDVYASRTSGVFVEALAAGKIVVATADTWMSDQLQRFGGGVVLRSRDPAQIIEALLRVRRGHGEFASDAWAAGMRFRKFHSPTRFIAALRDRHAGFARERRAAVIYPWRNFLSRAAGASLRTGLMMDLIQSCGYGLNVMLGSENDPVDPPASYRVFGFETEALRGTLLFYIFALGVRIGTLGRSRPAEGVLYMFTCWHRRRRYRLAVSRALRHCRVVFLEYAMLADVVAPLARAYGIPLVLSEHDVMADQAAWKPLSKKILALEIAALKLADMAVSVSESDRATFRRQGMETVLVPNSVCAVNRRIYGAEEGRAVLARAGIAPPRRFVLFVGSSHAPNRRAALFLRSLAERFAVQAADLAVIVVGTCHPPIGASSGFLALGLVSDELRDALYGAAAAVVVPLDKGTGSSLKTIEAMATGKAVIGTSIAFRGLGITDGYHAIVEDDLARYATLLPELLRQPDKLEGIGRKGRELALRFDYRETYAPYAEFLARLDGRPGAPAEGSENCVD